MRIWDASSGKCLKAMQGYSNSVFSVALCPQPHPASWQLASASTDQTIRLWDLETQTCLRVLRGHSRCSLSADLPAESGHPATRGSADPLVS